MTNLNRLIEVRLADGIKKEFKYDAVGNMTFASNDEITGKYTYDELSRLTKAENIGNINNDQKKVDFTYDPVGLITSVTTTVDKNNSPRKVSYQYDRLNRLEKVTLPDGGSTNFKYDPLNRVIERLNSNGVKTIFTYTARGEVETIVNYTGLNWGFEKVLTSLGYLYDAKGQRTYQVEENGDITAYLYDPAGQVKEVYYPANDNNKRVADEQEREYFGLRPTSYWQQRYEPNRNGNDGIRLTSEDATKLETIYKQVRQNPNALNPLNSGFWRERFTYDANGNVTKKENVHGAIDYQYNEANQLTQAGTRTYSYDNNGNLTKEIYKHHGLEHVVDYKYNHENRLVKVANNFATIQHHMSPNGKEITFTYDAMGRKVRKEITPFNQGQEKEVESYIYKGLGIDIIAEYQFKQPANNAGRTERINEYYYGNGKLVAVKELKFNGSHTFNWNNDTAQSVAFYSQDALGSVALLSDWHGHTIEKFEYDVYGVYYAGKFDKSTPGQGQGCGIGWHSNPYGFTGKRFEAELGIYSFAFRDYSPRTFRWMTEDPIKDGVNWYLYCSSNPIYFIDRYGLADLIAQDNKAYFVVESGDNLWTIVKNQNPAASDKEIQQRVNEIAEINNLDNKDKIQVGQKLLVTESVVPDITNDLFDKMRTNANDIWIQNPFYFKRKVQRNGDWDFKNQEGTIYDTTPLRYSEYLFNNTIVRYDAPGNIHYGYVGSAAWYGSQNRLLKGAGKAQIDDNPNNPNWKESQKNGGTGDDDVDAYYIKYGIELYRKDKNQCTKTR